MKDTLFSVAKTNLFSIVDNYQFEEDATVGLKKRTVGNCFEMRVSPIYDDVFTVLKTSEYKEHLILIGPLKLSICRCNFLMEWV